MAKAPVSTHALVQRINRMLQSQDTEIAQADRLRLRSTRGAQEQSFLGNFYLVDIYRDAIFGHHIDPEDLARKIGVLAKWEEHVMDETNAA